MREAAVCVSRGPCGPEIGFGPVGQVGPVAETHPAPCNLETTPGLFQGIAYTLYRRSISRRRTAKQPEVLRHLPRRRERTSGATRRLSHAHIRPIVEHRPHVGAPCRSHEHAVPIAAVSAYEHLGREHVGLTVAESAGGHSDGRANKALVLTSTRDLEVGPDWEEIGGRTVVELREPGEASVLREPACDSDPVRAHSIGCVLGHAAH
jgi:hypothetical protein